MYRIKLAFPLIALAAAFTLVRPATAAIDHDLLALVPESAVLVTGVDAEAMRNSDFGQYLLRRINSDDTNLQKFVEDTGFDPRRDLQSFLFVSFGPHRSRGNSKFAILAKGTFDPDRISAAVRVNQSFTRQSYKGAPLFMQTNASGSSAFAFPDTGLAVMGDAATVREILDHRTVATALDPGLLQRINKVGASNDLWFASLLSGAFLGNHMDFPATGTQLKDSSALQSILQSSGGVVFGEEVRLSFDATTRSPEDAVSLTDVVRFLSSMAQSQRRNDPNAAILASALDHMELQAAGQDVHMGLSVSEKNLELLAQSQAKHGQ